jgi:hypothetical protein
MAIDPRIALGVQQYRAPDQMQAAGQAMQLRAMQQSGQLRGLQMEEIQRQRAAEAEIRQIAQQSGGDIGKLVQALNARGLTQQAMALQEKALAMQKGRADLGKTEAETGVKQQDITRGAFAFLSRNPSDEAISATINGLVQRGALSPEIASGFGTDLMRLPPEQRARALAEASRTPQQLADLYKPEVREVNDGQTIQFRDVNPMTGGPMAPVQRQMTPGERQSARDAAAGRGVTLRGQDLARMTAQERLQWERDNPSTTAVPTDAGVFAVPNRGNTAARQVVTSDGRPLPGKMPESIRKELDSLDAQSAAIRSAIDAARKTPTAFSMPRGLATMGGAITESLAGRADSDEERKARSFVFNNASKIINERAGAAQTPAELARLRSFLPAETDTSEQIISKLEAYDEYARVQREAIASPVGSRPLANPRPEAPAAPPAAAVPPPSDTLPMPRSVPKGVIAIDSVTGKRMRNTGTAWEPMP